MRRIAIALSLAAVVVGLYSCAADAPTKPPSGGGGTPSSALQIQLFTSDANPKAGTCTLLEATVTLNGVTVPDGTGVSFSTDFGSFSQNGLPVVTIVTLNGSAVTALCGPSAGTAKVKATATVAGKTGSATLSISFLPSSGTLPFVSSCSPSLGSKNGGETLTLNGGRFFGSASTSRVQFTVNGVTRDGIVTSVTSNAVVVQTAAFPELTAASNPAAVTLTLGTNQPVPVVLSLPTCFTYGTLDSSTPNISALLPSSGTNEGNTRVTIIGSGFAANGVQVFFGAVEATVISTTFNQVVVLSPPAFGAGAANLNQTVSVTVKNINSGLISNGVAFRFTPAIQLTAISNSTQTVGFLSPVTITGQGFQAPVAVTLAGIPGSVQSVSATQLVVLPGTPLLESCGDISGNVTATNINSGDTAAGLGFTYVLPKPAITNINPNNSCPSVPCLNNGTGGGAVTISGVNFPGSIANADVKFGSLTAFVTSASPTSLSVTVPTTSVGPATCTNGNPAGTPQLAATVDVVVTDRTTTCSVTAAQAFQYLLPCTVVATPTP